MSILARVRGRIEERTADSVIIFAGGLGLELQAPLSTLNALPDGEAEVTLRTYLHVREGALGLYGFLTDAEQRTFELLLGVTGIGPKAALNCLSLLGPEQVAGAIAAGNADSLRRVPGVGRKTAERILLELKGKVAGLPHQAPPPSAAGQSIVVEALMALGHTAAEAAAAAASLPTDRSLSEQEQILLALQYFAPRSEHRMRET